MIMLTTFITPPLLKAVFERKRARRNRGADLRRLKTFLLVAATNSFTRAAAKLGYSQSSVTTHIQGLERELGGRRSIGSPGK